MSSLWLAWLPLLFLPSFGFGGPTAFGTLELSDFLIVPFLVLLRPARPWGSRLAIHRLTPILLGFIGWAVLSTLLIRERYGYAEHREVIGGIMKLSKLSLYAVAGVLASRALADDRRRHLFPWALTAAGIVVALALMLVHDEKVGNPGEAISGYKASNVVSVMMAVLICYLGGLWAAGPTTKGWRLVAPYALALMTGGFLLSHGRGGWIAALCGAGYVAFRRRLGVRMFLGLGGLAVVVAASYATSPDFSAEVDHTLWPDQDYMVRYQAGVGGFDDGARLSNWAHEVQSLARSPLLGTGFFHRGGSSGLWDTGSHNFFIQIFLETGLVGGLLALAVFWRMWTLAGSPQARAAGQEVPVRAALVAAVVGGLTGEYFYGGMVLFTLLLVFAPVGSTRRRNEDEPRAPTRTEDPLIAEDES